MQRRELLEGLMLGGVTAAVAGQAHASHAGREAEDPALTAEIEALLSQVEKAWNSQDFTRWIALWDADDARPYYLAAEEKDFFVRRDQLDAYVDPNGPAQITQGIRIGISDVSTRWLCDDLAFAAYHMSSEMKLAFADKPFISKVRVTAVVRRKSEGWRFICYTEAFQSPTMYFQQLIQDAVPEDYPEYFEEVMGRKIDDRG